MPTPPNLLVRLHCLLRGTAILGGTPCEKHSFVSEIPFSSPLTSIQMRQQEFSLPGHWGTIPPMLKRKLTLFHALCRLSLVPSLHVLFGPFPAGPSRAPLKHHLSAARQPRTALCATHHIFACPFLFHGFSSSISTKHLFTRTNRATTICEDGRLRDRGHAAQVFLIMMPRQLLVGWARSRTLS